MGSMTDLNIFRHWRVIIFCALIMTIPAILNGYPFLFQDSADYIGRYIRIYRLPVYGTFANIGTLFGTLWVVAFAQAMIISHLIYSINRVYFRKVNLLYFIAQIAILTAFSSLPYFSAFIMADVFTPILFLCLYLIIFHHKKFKLGTNIYFHALAIFAAMAHITNIYLGVGLIIFSTFVILVRNNFEFKSLAKLWRPVAIIAIASSYLVALNAYYFNAISLSPSSPVFTLANLVEQGSARTYLQGACPNKDLKLCKYLKVLPRNVDGFLWGVNGLTQKIGSFANMRHEAYFIVRNTIAYYPQEVVKHSADYFVRSFTIHAPAKELNSSVARADVKDVLIKVYDRYETMAFLNSKQAKETLPYELIQNIDAWVYPISLAITMCFAIFALTRLRDNRFTFPLFVFVYILGNNLLCSTASGLFDRYQARVSWLLVLAILLMLGIMAQNIKQNKLLAKQQA